jgi:hypothetical protein
VEECLSLLKIIGLVLLVVFVARERSAARRAKDEPDADFQDVELHPEPRTEIIEGYKNWWLPWGTASGARDALPVKTVIVGNRGQYVRCEQLSLDGREVVRTTEVDALGRPCGTERLQLGSMDERIRELI